MRLYKTQFVRFICNISQFVQIKTFALMLSVVLLLSLFWGFVAIAPVFAQTQEQWDACYDTGGSLTADCCGMSGFESASECNGTGGDDPPPAPPPELMSWGTFYCNIFSRLLWVWPSTPDGLRLVDLASSLASSIPFVGDRLVYLIFQDLFSVLTLIVAVKLIKVLPAKF